MPSIVPDAAAVEEVFVNKNPQSTLKLGQARGVVLMVAARSGLAVGEYAARLVKKAVVGTGSAEKAQVHAMVQRLLPGAKIAGADAADALAVAITHAHHLASAGIPMPFGLSDEAVLSVQSALRRLRTNGEGRNDRAPLRNPRRNERRHPPSSTSAGSATRCSPAPAPSTRSARSAATC